MKRIMTILMIIAIPMSSFAFPNVEVGAMIPYSFNRVLVSDPEGLPEYFELYGISPDGSSVRLFETRLSAMTWELEATIYDNGSWIAVDMASAEGKAHREFPVRRLRRPPDSGSPVKRPLSILQGRGNIPETASFASSSEESFISDCITRIFPSSTTSSAGIFIVLGFFTLAGIIVPAIKPRGFRSSILIGALSVCACFLCIFVRDTRPVLILVRPPVDGPPYIYSVSRKLALEAGIMTFAYRSNGEISPNLPDEFFRLYINEKRGPDPQALFADRYVDFIVSPSTVLEPDGTSYLAGPTTLTGWRLHGN